MSEADDSFELSEILAGDFNGDGNVNSKDVYSLVRYCAHYYGNDDNKFNLEAGDYNRDSHIDSRDILGIIRYLAGWGSGIPQEKRKILTRCSTASHTRQAKPSQPSVRSKKVPQCL